MEVNATRDGVTAPAVVPFPAELDHGQEQHTSDSCSVKGNHQCPLLVGC
jgi:hypothetical protein